MEKGKHEKKKVKLIEKYTVLLLIATIFISIGYANIIDQELTITGSSAANAQDGVFITDVVYASDTSADKENSKINYFTETMMESNVVLGGSGSSITYAVTVYNSTDREQLFIKAITDKTDPLQYSNTNIGYSVASIGNLIGLEEYVTTLAPGETRTFPITFSYTGTNTSNNTLLSKLNFRFREKPIIELSNEGETYTLEDIYAGYTPEEIEFTVSNYNQTKNNSVPMKYTFETTIDSPLQAKIYDESGNEVTGEITIGGETQEAHNYTLKIIWESGLTYNEETASCKVELKAQPTEEKYLDYEITKEFNVDMNTTCVHNWENGVCTKCGETCSHEWGEWETTTAATCTTNGTQTRTCLVCGSTETQTIQATGHSYSGGICTICGLCNGQTDICTTTACLLNPITCPTCNGTGGSGDCPNCVGGFYCTTCDSTGKLVCGKSTMGTLSHAPRRLMLCGRLF